MKKWLFAAIALALITPAHSQTNTAITNFIPGGGPSAGLVSATKLNQMVNAVNSLTGTCSGTACVTAKGYFSLNSGTGPTALATTVIQGVGANATNSRFELDAYGGVPLVSVVRRDGTKASPTAILSTEQLGSFNFHGASTTALVYGPAARLSAMATENWSGTAGGTKLVFSTTPNTTHTLTDALTIDQDQSLTLVAALNTPKHVNTGATPPVLTSCGTGSPAITGSDTAGIVTLGTSATGCVITFAVAYTGTPYCVVSWIATPLASQSYVTANTAITLTQTSASGNKVQYVCVGPSGG